MDTDLARLIVSFIALALLCAALLVEFVYLILQRRRDLQDLQRRLAQARLQITVRAPDVEAFRASTSQPPLGSGLLALRRRHRRPPPSI